MFASLLNKGQFLKVRVCSSRSKFFPFRADPFKKNFSVQDSKGEVTNFVVLCKNGGRGGAGQIFSLFECLSCGCMRSD